MVFISTILAIIPAAIYTAIIYWVDRYEKEPLWLLTATFLWGAIPAVVVALIFNILFGAPFYILFEPVGAEAAIATFVAPLVEESAKGFVLLLILFFWRHQIDGLLDGIIYGATVGMGFAMVENIFYFVQYFEDISTLFILRSIVFGLNHSLFSSLTGLGIAVSRLSTNRSTSIAAPIVGWTGAVFLHFLHNGLSSYGGVVAPGIICIPLFVNAWGGVIVLILIIVWALIQERQWLKKYLAKEVTLGTMTTRQFEISASTLGRLQHNLSLITSGQFARLRKSRQFFNQSSKLAYANHHYETYPDEENLDRLKGLRHEVNRLGTTLL